MNTLDFAKKLIAVRSTADNQQALKEALDMVAEAIAAQPNLTVERLESGSKPSLLAYHGATRPKRFHVLLNGHLDVVAAKDEQFIPEVKDNKLYGRGALDMKTAALVLAEVFCEQAGKLPYALGLQIVTDEEIGGAHGTLYQLEQGVETDFAIAGEFTPQGAICNESRGICWAEVEFKGTAAHSAYLWNGRNAILMAQDYTAKLHQAYPIPEKDEWCTTANVATISTTNATLNRVPDQATVGLDIRYVAEDTRFATRESAAKFLQDLTPEATVTVKMFEPSHYVDPNNPQLKKLLQAVTETSGQKAHLIRKHGAADIRFFTDRNMPAVVLGLQGEGLHGDDEYVEIDSIERYKKSLCLFLQSQQ